MATLAPSKPMISNLNERKYKPVTVGNRQKPNIASSDFAELKDSENENHGKNFKMKRSLSVKAVPLISKSNENVNPEVPSRHIGAAITPLRKKEFKDQKPTMASNIQCFQRPGAVFAEVANLNAKVKETKTLNRIQSFSRKSLEDNALSTPKQSLASAPKNLNSSHPPVARLHTPLHTPNVNGKPLLRNNLQSCTPVTPKIVVSKPTKSTPLEASAKRRSSIKKSVNNFRSRVSIDDAGHENGALDSPAFKASQNNYQNSRSNLRRVSSARKSSNYQNSPYLNIPSSFNTPISSQQHSLLGTLGTPSDVRLTKYDTSSEWDIALDQQEDESSTVSVGIRVRPINSRESSNPNIRNIIDIRGEEISVRCENGTSHSFTYDHCLWSCDEHHRNYASQEDVYQEMALPLLDHAYEGYNVCLFAYGQTGSGKSYCIMGEDNDFSIDTRGISKEAGIIPRFCQDLFTRADEIHSNNGIQDVKNRIIVEISYIEIYNEKIYDLVGSQNSFQGEDGEKIPNCHHLVGDKRDALKVREHPHTGPYVVGASWHLVTTYKDLLTWITLGNNQRSIAATGMNDKSSRSHSVFSIKVTQIKKIIVSNEEMEHSLISMINLVDLAGSERVAAATNMDVDRLKEGVSINKSLLTLGKVISALAENAGRRKAFIPYRESVLTWLLKESLGGNSKTAMIATVSPCNIYQEETLSTLRFACQARKIVNWNHINEDPTLKIIKALKLEVERLRAQQLGSPPLVSHLEYDKEDTELIITDINVVDEEEKQLIKFMEKEEMERKRLRECEEFEAKERKILLLEEKLKKSQEQILEKEKIWNEKFKDSELKKNEALERCRLKGIVLKLEDNKPSLVNLCEDPQLSEMLLYGLKKGSTTLGEANSDVTLSGLHSKDIHCTIFYEGEKLILHPMEKTETYVNGILVSGKTEIFHNDRIVLAGIYYFRVCFPSEDDKKITCDNEQKLDFIFARDEVLKAQKERLYKELTLQQEASRAEMLQELDEHRSLFNQEKSALNENMKLLAEELEVERKQIRAAELAKLHLEEKNFFLENQMKQFRRRSSIVSESFSPVLEDHFLEQMESVFNESMQIIESNAVQIKANDVETHFMIMEANKICKLLKKSYEFQQQTQLTSQGLEPTAVVYDLEHYLTAIISVIQLKNVLQLLRDVASGYQEDDNLFETSIKWERSDEVTKLPGVINRMKTNAQKYSMNASFNSSMGNALNISMNSTLMGPPQSSRKIGAPRRRSLLNQSQMKSSSLATAPSVACDGRCVAKALAEVLLNQAAVEHRVPPFYDAISKLICFQANIKAIMNHYQQPNLVMESEVTLGTDLVKLGLSMQCLTCSLQNAALIPLSKITDMDDDFHSPINTLCNKLTRKVARMLQGVEKEIDSLIEEENSEILKLIDEACENIAFLNILGSDSLTQNMPLFTEMNICKSYCAGIGRGLEWQVKNASKITKGIASDLQVLSSQNEITLLKHISDVRTEACHAICNIAAFLDQFSKLKVALSLSEDKNSHISKEEINQFLRRVESASDNIYQLAYSANIVLQELRLLSQVESINFSNLSDSVASLQENLSQIIQDADIETTYQKDKSSEANHQLKPTAENEMHIRTNLDKLATKAVKLVKSLRYALDELERSNKKAFLKEEQVFLPLKSSLKTGFKNIEEKKVRFKVSLGSSPRKDCCKEVDLV